MPLRITPRTPIESAFRVTEPWVRCALEPALPHVAEGLKRLHIHLHLTWHYATGGTETLVPGLELFHLLLELKDGVQLSGVGEEAIFAQLDIFTARLASEDARPLNGWHPSDEQNLYEVRIEARAGRQVLVRERVAVWSDPHQPAPGHRSRPTTEVPEHDYARHLRDDRGRAPRDHGGPLGVAEGHRHRTCVAPLARGDPER